MLNQRNIGIVKAGDASTCEVRKVVLYLVRLLLLFKSSLILALELLETLITILDSRTTILRETYAELRGVLPVVKRARPAEAVTAAFEALGDAVMVNVWDIETAALTVLKST